VRTIVLGGFATNFGVESTARDAYERGYAPEEIVTFKNVPVPMVGPSNSTPMTNMAGGVPVVLREFLRKPDLTNIASWPSATIIRFELSTHPAGVALDFVEITTDTGEKAGIYGHAWRSPSDRELLLASIPAGVQTMDITWVAQKTRSVEFLVKPPK